MSTSLRSSVKNSDGWDRAHRDKLIEPAALEAQVAALRAQDKSIATLNGSFDLLHAGHLHILYEASKQADVLIVALNSDASIQAYKSPLRPIITLPYRLQLMAAIGFVDYVTWFEETDPCALLRRIQPDVHVNGTEYGADCIEATTLRELGTTLHLVPLIPGLSTTAVLSKVRTCD